MGIMKVKGIVIKQVNINESDKILTILTEENGKIEAVAKGCRKPKSQLLASTQLFTVSNFVLYEGRNLSRISQSELLQSFHALRNDLTLLTYATYFAELANVVSLKQIPMRNLFILLCNALYYIVQEKSKVKFIKIAFQLKIANIAGIKPVLDYCACCNEKNQSLDRFSIEAGGLVCIKCFENQRDSKKIGLGTVEVMKLIYYTKFAQLHTIQINYQILNQMDPIMDQFLETHLDEKFKSLQFITLLDEHR